MKEKILCVDDDPKILRGYRRQMQDLFELETAESGHQGLEVVKERGPFSVIVSDMRMPEMDGIQFLAKVQNCSPDSVKMILTGYADLETAIRAVNEGNIFRFLTKPCPPKTLTKMLHDGIRQYRLIMSERELRKKERQVAISAIIVTLNHRINNALAPLSAWEHFAAKKRDEGTDQKEMKIIDTMIEQMNYIVRLVSVITELSRTENLDQIQYTNYLSNDLMLDIENLLHTVHN